jgi:AcrR family transcriptional regulator
MSQAQTGTRRRLEEAMIALCVERGFRNVTVAALLERAGAGRGELEAEFGDLEDCYAQIYTVQRDEFVACVAGAFFSREVWRERMRAAAHAMLEFLREDPRRAYFMSVEVHAAGDRARLIRDEAMQGFFALIDQGRAEMADPDQLTPHTAEAIGSAIYQQFQAAIADHDFERLERMIPEMMYAAVLPYLGVGAALEELQIPAPPR